MAASLLSPFWAAPFAGAKGPCDTFVTHAAQDC